jgi:hypothetical protein
MSDQRDITGVTRRQILDHIALERLPWSGRLDEVSFLSRLYDLESMPSTDNRYATAAGDIRQHRIRNADWEDDWVFTDARFGLMDGPDKVLLTFLAEMLHPIVRSDTTEAARLQELFNASLVADGYELVRAQPISGRPTYKGERRGSFHGATPALELDRRQLLTDPRVLHEHLTRIRDAVDKDPAAAIGSCKELVESLCKLILERSGVTYPVSEDLPALYRRVAGLLKLKAESVPTSAKGSETAQRILRTLATTVQGLAELRNELGLGHGRTSPSPALTRHARLALNSTVTVTEFLLDTWEARVVMGEIAPSTDL